MRVLIRDPEREELIVCFLGCGVSEASIAHLEESTSKGRVVLYDYRDLSLPSIVQEVVRGKTIWLVAWSMGVWVAARVWPQIGINPQRAIAFMGTPFGIHDAYGIPPGWFLATHRSCSPAVQKEFLRRSGMRNPEGMRPVQEWQEELAVLWRERKAPAPERPLFSLAVVGKEDRIFPPEAQERGWSRRGVPYLVLPLPHYPFHHFVSWEEVIRVGSLT
ncbi:alpha/beta fold hydrolase [Spirochaeta thermophila]|uniref:Uncharacterized protein n=1 Tax=Winmispira thermophila (strain ATCC 49972 / DSM 6192 / RI 19.B1) TaxID=665571 RepID=E0RU47_WINT6|nr:alpha/beta fold hydrolase [Spirochaeta thermophila]ADN02268.1 hypothetical protein STHERM_c13270 [Spirochaeta thermophila DSM 6192]